MGVCSGTSWAGDDTVPRKSELKIGDMAPNGDRKHKGFAYGGTDPRDGRPLWFKFSRKLMNHFEAAAWAKRLGGSLATWGQGEQVNMAKDKCEFATMYEQAASRKVAFWMDDNWQDYARVHAFHCGSQINFFSRYESLPALCVKR